MYREFLQKATPYSAASVDTTGWFYSEFGTGVRCFWDGGITRGVAVGTIPWANTRYPRTNSFRVGLPARASGMWSENGLPLIVPDTLLNQLPRMALDGELLLPDFTEQEKSYFNRGELRLKAEFRFSYAVDTCPPLESVFRTGEINSNEFIKEVDAKVISRWMGNLRDDPLDEYGFVPASTSFDARLNIVADAIGTGGRDVHLRLHKKLPDDIYESARKLDFLVQPDNRPKNAVLILTEPSSVWVPKIVSSLLFFDFREARR